jgi:hypothetical protein
MKISLPRIPEAKVITQAKKLGTPGRKASPRGLIDEAQRGLIPPALGRGGRGKPKTYAAETAADRHANAIVFQDAPVNLTLNQLRKTGELGRKFYELVCQISRENFENYNRILNQLSDLLQGQESFAAPVGHWVCERRLALIVLYGESAVDNRNLWTMPDVLTDFIIYLSRGWMRTWTMSPDGKIIRPAPAPGLAVEDTFSASIEPAAIGMSAKAGD